MRVVLFICLALVLCRPSPASAEDGKMTAEQFYRLTHVFMTNRGKHDKYIEDCAAGFLKAANQAQLDEVAKFNNLPADKAITEICRNLIKGIAGGRITYTTYLAWWDANGIIIVPDYN